MIAALAAVVGGLLLTGSAAAAAPVAPQMQRTVAHRVTTTAGCTFYYAFVRWSDGTLAGWAKWSQDPCAETGDPGDALAASDQLADGYGINAYLSTGRKATTAGHDSPYTSQWKTGDLPEDTTYGMQACLEKGGVDYTCGAVISVSS